MSRAEFDEAEAWSKARDGDGAAFASLFDVHRDRVFGQALRLLRHSHDAEDVTAIVFLEAWRRRDAVRLVNGSIIPWLLVTTNYTVRNHDRSIRRYRLALARLPRPTEQDDHAPDIDASIDNDADNKRVRDAFARLAPRDQDVITLCVLEELPLSEAAEVLGVPVGTVKSRLSRARQRLAELTTTTLPNILEGGAE
jgi:RNA polymerase sigma-70 factor (ECF subfamily)